MTNALLMNWALTDDFQFYFDNKRKLTHSALSIQDLYDVTIKNIDLPQLGSSVESTMVGGEWRIYNSVFQPFTLTVTFRDFGGLDLRNYFSAVWMDAQRGYFKDVASTIKISIGGKLVFESAYCLITSVSQVQLDNSNSQVAEFSVEFTSPYYTNDAVKNFGKDNWDGQDFNLGASVSGSAIGSVVSSGVSGLQNVISISNTLASWF
jgi:hypothetical protein